MPHPLIMLSTVGGLACVGCCIRCQVRRDRKAYPLAAWVRSQHPEAWNAVPRWMRMWASAPYLLAVPILALSVLARRRLVSDQAFSDRYAELHRLNRSMAGWAILGFGVLCIAIIGSRVWGWQW